LGYIKVFVWVRLIYGEHSSEIVKMGNLYDEISARVYALDEADGVKYIV